MRFDYEGIFMIKTKKKPEPEEGFRHTRELEKYNKWVKK